MTRGKAILIGGISVVAFIAVAVVLGATVFFAAVTFLIGPHGSGILPEWSNPLVLVFLVGGVGYVSCKVAMWTQAALARRLGAI